MQPNQTLEALAREAAELATFSIMKLVGIPDSKIKDASLFQQKLEVAGTLTPIILSVLTLATEPLEKKILTLNQLNIDACAFEDELIKKLNVPARIDDQDEVDSARILKAVERLQADCVVMRKAFHNYPHVPSHQTCLDVLNSPHPGQHLLDELLRLRVTANERDSLLVENATLREQLTEALKEVPTADTAILTKMFRKP